MLKLFSIVCASVLALCLSACSQSNKLSQAQLDYAKTAVPSDAALAEIYRRSCQTCHANPNTLAPLTGDSDAWQSRLDKGMQPLLDNVINGYQGMPPLGLCMDCSAEEFTALVEFMAKDGRETSDK